MSKELGISRERVRQIEQTALAKVRAALEAKGLTATTLDSAGTEIRGFYDVCSPTPHLIYKD
ncbi:sigma factor-like helix-turn-helix DNA-binding protein [Candidatus Marimicrobium litorale]|uniref:RNA polymerase sigma-70 region 4 domain-containing protein n=1 Tax=Candidatus Marimicrobium litorale TaxID=2518991 RepID=A0ABT3T294_9GAMM|nr:sigma factor-like helix-turn-helix DNA-binding protein [Candidatus Marimicrobium litorale]MCX2976374.1 hypothetical protein [Candidatus Marimicrobium litorale]